MFSLLWDHLSWTRTRTHKVPIILEMHRRLCAGYQECITDLKDLLWKQDLKYLINVYKWTALWNINWIKSIFQVNLIFLQRFTLFLLVFVCVCVCVCVNALEYRYPQIPEEDTVRSPGVGVPSYCKPIMGAGNWALGSSSVFSYPLSHLSSFLKIYTVFRFGRQGWHCNLAGLDLQVILFLKC